MRPSIVLIDFESVQPESLTVLTPEYFRLPYNEEQETIVARLERSPDVCVQEPPGTGKTHTIANIICHYLATGRRVLVTSRGEPALEVLQGKIPEEIRPLTVALLTNDREGMRQFQNAIDTIQHQVSQIDVLGVTRQIEQNKAAIDHVHRELAAIDRRIDDIAQAQLADIEVDGQSLRAQKLAEPVVSGAARFSFALPSGIALCDAERRKMGSRITSRTRSARGTNAQRSLGDTGTK